MMELEMVTTEFLRRVMLQQIITTNIPTLSLFYKPDALPVSQSKVWKHLRQSIIAYHRHPEQQAVCFAILQTNDESSQLIQFC